MASPRLKAATSTAVQQSPSSTPRGRRLRQTRWITKNQINDEAGDRTPVIIEDDIRKRLLDSAFPFFNHIV